MSYPVYKIIHVFAALLLFTALGGAALHNVRGGTRDDNPERGRIGATHGLAMVLLLFAGFGAAGKGGMLHHGLPGWVVAKLFLWLGFGAVIVVLNRAGGSGRWLWWALPALGTLAASFAILKPF